MVLDYYFYYFYLFFLDESNTNIFVYSLFCYLNDSNPEEKKLGDKKYRFYRKDFGCSNLTF